MTGQGSLLRTILTKLLKESVWTAMLVSYMQRIKYLNISVQRNM